jgi:hypothetical protein
MEIEIIKTENPDVVIERRIQEKEINLNDLEIRKNMVQDQISQMVELIIDENFPDEIKQIIEEKNNLIRAEKFQYEMELQNIKNDLYRYRNI